MSPKDGKKRIQGLPYPPEVNEFCRIIARILRRGRGRTCFPKDHREGATKVQDSPGRKPPKGSGK